MFITGPAKWNGHAPELYPRTDKTGGDRFSPVENNSPEAKRYAST